MNIPRPLRKLVKRLKGDTSTETVLIRGLQNIYIDDSSDQKLQQIRQRFIVSRGHVDEDLMNSREQIYSGTSAVDLNVNNANTNINPKDSNQPYNIVYELLEAQVDNALPQPTVKSKRKDYQYQAKMIEDAIKNDMVDSDINMINDKNERTTFKHGWSAVEVLFDMAKNGQNYAGEISLMQRHPKSIVPQAGVWDDEYMDYMFTQLSVTKQYVYQKFGVVLTSETEQFPSVNIVDDGLINNLSEKVTLITCWYKDSDGDIGNFTWVQNKVLLDLPKFFYRRPSKCEDCGQVQPPDNPKKCECGGKFKKQLEMYEVLAEDKVLQRQEPVLDAQGNPVMQQDPQTGQPTNQPMMKNVVIPAGTKIKYFAPKKFPIIFRTNVPSDFGFGGISDIDVIRDKYMLLAKLMNNIEEKLLRGGKFIGMPETLKANITEQIYQVVRGTQQDLAGIHLFDLTLDVQKDLEVAREIYNQAKSLLGITDAYMGKPDPTAQSGVAKQLQIAQSSGRMRSKEYNKYEFYVQLFKMMFYFKLAFYDEARPVVSKDDSGQERYFDFNKYEFLLQDDNGEWYYNTDFIFTVDTTGGWERNRDFMYQQTMQMFTSGAFNASPQTMAFWTMMDNFNFPNAAAMKQQIEQQLKNSSTLPKDKTNININFKDLPPTAQVQVLAKEGIQINPNEAVQYKEQNQEPNTSVDMHGIMAEVGKTNPQALHNFAMMHPDKQQEILKQIHDHVLNGGK